MICIFKLEELSYNTFAQPTSWLMGHNINHAIQNAIDVGETEIAAELKRRKHELVCGKHLLEHDNNLWALVS